MKRRLRTPLALAAVALALAAYIALLERHHDTTDDARAARSQLCPGLSHPSVTRIDIERAAQGRVTLARGAPAFDDLLDAIDAAEIDREATSDARAAGLDPPAARLVASARDVGCTVDVGARDASGRGLFIRRAGDPRIWVLGSAHLRDLIDRGAEAPRDH